MRKRILSILLVLALCLAYLPVPVHAAEVNLSAYSTFEDALADAGDGGTIVVDVDYETDVLVDSNTYSYTLDLHGNTFVLTGSDGFQTDANWTIIDTVGGGSFTAEKIALNAGLANDNPVFTVGGSSSESFTFNVTSSISVPSMTDSGTITIGSSAGGSIAVDIGSVSSGAASTTVVIDFVSGSIGDIDTTSVSTSSITVKNLNETLEIGTVRVQNCPANIELNHATGASFTTIESTASETSSMLLMNSECTVDTLTWKSNNPIRVEGSSSLTIETQTNTSYSSDSTIEAFAFGDDSDKVVITNPANISSTDAAWLASYLDLHAAGPVAVSENSGNIAVEPASENPDGSARTVGKLVLKNTTAIEQAHFIVVTDGDPASDESLDAVFTTKVYNGEEQELFPLPEDVIGGTVWYCLDRTAATPEWTTTVPTATDAGTFPNASYWIAGSDEYKDTDGIYDTRAGAVGVGITPLAVTVSITGNTDSVLYDGEEQTVSGYTAVADVELYNADTDLYYDNGVGDQPSVSGTNAGTYEMGLQDDIDNGYFQNNNTNFEVTPELAADGSLTIEKRMILLTSGSSSKKYDGTALTEETVTPGRDDWADGEGAIYTFTGSQTEVGASDNTFIYLLNDGTLEDNYTIEVEYGTLTVTALTPITIKAEDAEKTYGEDDPEFTATVTLNETSEVDYDFSGLVYTFTREDGEDAGEYVITPAGDAEQGEFSIVYEAGTLVIEPKEAKITAADKTVSQGQAAPNLTAADYTITGLAAGDDLAADIWIYYGDDPANPIAAADVDTTAAGTVPISIELDTPNPNYDITVTGGTLTIRAAGAGSTPKTASYDFTSPRTGVGSYTSSVTVYTWGGRAKLPKDIATLYMFLANNSVADAEGKALFYPHLGTDHFLTRDDIWILPDSDPEPGRTYPVETVQVCEDHEPFYRANGDGKVDQSTFANSNFYDVAIGTGDKSIDFANLTTGDVVSNTTFNGVYVTKVAKSSNPSYEANLTQLKNDAIASFRAFELDHPEVFWLTGSVKLRVLTVTINGAQTSYIFMTLVDDKGFTMRIADYAAPGAIEAAIQQRDTAAAAIIAQVPASGTVREKIAFLNKWFTTNNEYNRSSDLNSIGYTPHRSLKSLLGNEGASGPVCDGYSRGLKVICDRLGIPMILDTGVASIGSHSELHMWTRVQVDGAWYGFDCTWDDPIVSGKNGKISGYENEKYLLVGNDTVVDGKTFGVSHPSNQTAGGTTGVLFASLMMNTDAIDGYTPLDFEDVRLADWFYEFVKKAVDKGLMGGTSESVFTPQGTATRGQIVQILYNAAGQPAVDEIKVEGWYGKAATWAMEKGIVAGYSDGLFHGDDPVTREQLATILWAYAGAPVITGSTLDYADKDAIHEYALNAILWAKAEGIIGGKPGNLADPQGTATRAEIATIFSNFIK